MKQDLNAPRKKAVFEEKEGDPVVDLKNKTEAPTPQHQRKAIFGPFEVSFEEEEIPDEPKKASDGIRLWNHLPQTL